MRDGTFDVGCVVHHLVTQISFPRSALLTDDKVDRENSVGRTTLAVPSDCQSPNFIVRVACSGQGGTRGGGLRPPPCQQHLPLSGPPSLLKGSESQADLGVRRRRSEDLTSSQCQDSGES